MKKFLLFVCLGLMFTSHVYSQNCVIFDNGVDGPSNAFCFKDATLSSPAEIIISEDEFNSLTIDDIKDRYIDEFDVGSCDGSQKVRVRRNQLQGRNTSSSRSNNGEILETIIFDVEFTGNCTGNLILTFRAAPEPIPTLSQWGLFIFGLIILNMGIIFLIIKRRLEIA